MMEFNVRIINFMVEKALDIIIFESTNWSKLLTPLPPPRVSAVRLLLNFDVLDAPISSNIEPTAFAARICCNIPILRQYT